MPCGEPPEGMTRTEIRRGVFGDNKAADFVAAKMAILLTMRLDPVGGGRDRGTQRRAVVCRLPLREKREIRGKPPVVAPFPRQSR